MNSYEKRIFSVGLVLVIVLSLFFAQTTFGTRIDYVIGDQITDTHIRDEVTVVGIDDASLQKIGAWPWKRDVFAQLLETLNKQGARLVVFDILFLEERDGDAAMKKMLAESKIPVIFASKLDKDSNLILPVYSDSKYFNHGVAHVYPDDDGKVRVIPFFQKDSRGECHKSLAYQAFITYSKKDMDPCETSLHAFLFQDISPTTLSFIDVIEGRIPDPVIKDKIIFIGSNSLDIEDHFIGRSGEKIPGIYVHRRARSSPDSISHGRLRSAPTGVMPRAASCLRWVACRRRPATRAHAPPV